MKIVEGFILRKVGKDQVVVAIGKASVKLNGMIRLNDSGALLWNLLKEGAEEEQLIQALEGEYGISKEQAKNDAQAFLSVLRSVGCIEE